MNRDEMSNFIKSLLMAWQLRDAQKLEAMYNQDVVGYMDDKVVNFRDIMNRLQFSKDKFREVSNEIQDIIIENDKAVVRIKQTLIPRENKEPTIYHITSIFRVVNEKVVTTWSSFYPNVNYLNNN